MEKLLWVVSIRNRAMVSHLFLADMAHPILGRLVLLCHLDHLFDRVYLFWINRIPNTSIYFCFKIHIPFMDKSYRREYVAHLVIIIFINCLEMLSKVTFLFLRKCSFESLLFLSFLRFLSA